MHEYWLISVPGGKSSDETFNRIKGLKEKVEGCLCHRFNFPVNELRVGTLDSLVELSDVLQKQDQYIEGVVRKLVSYLSEVLDNQADSLEDYLMIANRTGYRPYLEHFGWDFAKYPVKQPLKDLVDHIVREVGQVEAELKSKSQDYTALKNTISSYSRQQTGSLITRDLDAIVKREHVENVIGSEYFTTAIVVVPNTLCEDWEKSYETLLPEKVVPRSSMRIFNDQDHTLYTVTLFTAQMAPFKEKCREKKFLVRNYTYDEQLMSQNKQKQKELEEKRNKQYRNLVPWLKIQFGEIFSAWIHIKALRVFVESVLRYGLPVNFVSALLLPKPKSFKRLRDLLNREFDTSEGKSLSEDIEMSRQFGIQAEEFYPYVYYSIKLDFATGSSVAN